MQKLIKGFTLIELIVVIVILSVLAVVAAPKFLDVQDEAMIATNRGIAAAFQTSIDLANYKWLLRGYTGEISNASDILDGSFNFNSNGFPVDALDRIGLKNPNFVELPNDNRCGRIWNNLLSHGVSLDENGSGSPNRFYFAEPNGQYIVLEAEGSVCVFQQTGNPSNTIRYDTQTGDVTAVAN